MANHKQYSAQNKDKRCESKGKQESRKKGKNDTLSEKVRRLSFALRSATKGIFSASPTSPNNEQIGGGQSSEGQPSANTAQDIPQATPSQATPPLPTRPPVRVLEARAAAQERRAEKQTIAALRGVMQKLKKKSDKITKQWQKVRKSKAIHCGTVKEGESRLVRTTKAEQCKEVDDALASAKQRYNTCVLKAESVGSFKACVRTADKKLSSIGKKVVDTASALQNNSRSLSRWKLPQSALRKLTRDGSIYEGTCYGTRACGDNPSSNASTMDNRGGRLYPDRQRVAAVGFDSPYKYGDVLAVCNGGNCTTLVVRDTCPECTNRGVIDITGLGAEDLKFDGGIGRVNITVRKIGRTSSGTTF